MTKRTASQAALLASSALTPPSSASCTFSRSTQFPPLTLWLQYCFDLQNTQFLNRIKACLVPRGVAKWFCVYFAIMETSVEADHLHTGKKRRERNVDIVTYKIGHTPKRLFRGELSNFVCCYKLTCVLTFPLRLQVLTRRNCWRRKRTFSTTASFPTLPNWMRRKSTTAKEKVRLHS